MSMGAAALGAWIIVQPMILPPLPIILPPIPRHVPLPDIDIPLQGQIDRIVIDKSDRILSVWRAGKQLKTYSVALGFAPTGDKSRQGDGMTPEGLFRIDRRNDRSAYHLSLGIDYPQADDTSRARAAGVDPGGDIFIHGQPNQRPDGEVLAGDWTAGCIALSDDQIREIWDAAPAGTVVEIRP